MITGYYTICSKLHLYCCLGYNWQCEEMSCNNMWTMALDSQLPWPNAPAKSYDEGHYNWFEKISHIAAFIDVSIFSPPASLTLYSDHWPLKVIKIVSIITTYFSHSNYATHHLKEELKKEKDQQGIQVAGATRFSSFSIHAPIIARCLPAIQWCMDLGTINFDTAAVRFFNLQESILLIESRQSLFAAP